MISSSTLSNLELGVVSMLASFIITVIILLSILIFIQLKIRTKEEPTYSSIKMKKLNTSVSMLSGVKTVFHFNNRVLMLHDNDDSKLSYNVMFRTATEKLVLKINSITIGGRTMTTKPYLFDLKEIFFRIHLNNIATNGMVVSEPYNFVLNVSVDEMFFFPIKEYQLKSTVLTIELFGTRVDNKCDVLLGSVEINLPGGLVHYPLKKCSVLKEVYRPIDLYLRQIGYLCIGLLSICDKIKVSIFASIYSGQLFENESEEDTGVFFTVEVQSDLTSKLDQSCETTTKSLISTIEWNEIFLLDVANDRKKEAIINIGLWRTSVNSSMTEGAAELLGSVKLGLSNQCHERSQIHWKYMVDNEKEESSKWHPICLSE